MIARKTEESLINIQINLNIINLPIEGDIFADGLSQINIKAKDDLINNIQIKGNVIINSE